MCQIPLRAAWLLVSLAAAWTPHTAAAFSIPMRSDLFLAVRSSDCDSGYSPCNNSNVPSNFCCANGSVCNVLAANTTIVCCPDGEDCSLLYPITCDLTQQNVDLHPEAPILTTALNGVMNQCGNGTCCPFGYVCDSADQCLESTNQNAAPITTGTLSSTTSTTSSTTTAKTTTSSSTSTTESTVAVVPTSDTSSTATTSSQTTTATSTSTTSSAPESTSTESSSGGSQTASVAGGVIGGVAGAMMIGAGLWFLWGRRIRRQQERSDSPSHKLRRSTSSFGNIINRPLSISSPKPQGDASTFRTDFIRMQSASPEPEGYGYARTMSPPSGSGGGSYGGTGSPPSTSAGASAGGGAGASTTATAGQTCPPSLAWLQDRDSVAVPPIRNMRASMQPQPRATNSEEINVVADPSIMGYGDGFRSSRESLDLSLPVPPIPEDQQQARSNARMTRFTTMMDAANVNFDHFVPDNTQTTPAPPRR